MRPGLVDPTPRVFLGESLIAVVGDVLFHERHAGGPAGVGIVREAWAGKPRAVVEPRGYDPLSPEPTLYVLIKNYSKGWKESRGVSEKLFIIIQTHRRARAVENPSSGALFLKVKSQYRYVKILTGWIFI